MALFLCPNLMFFYSPGIKHVSWQSAVICGVVVERAGYVGALVVFIYAILHRGFKETKTGAMK